MTAGHDTAEEFIRKRRVFDYEQKALHPLDQDCAYCMGEGTLSRINGSTDIICLPGSQYGLCAICLGTRRPRKTSTVNDAVWQERLAIMRFQADDHANNPVAHRIGLQPVSESTPTGAEWSSHASPWYICLTRNEMNELVDHSKRILKDERYRHVLEGAVYPPKSCEWLLFVFGGYNADAAFAGPGWVHQLVRDMYGRWSPRRYHLYLLEGPEQDDPHLTWSNEFVRKIRGT